MLFRSARPARQTSEKDVLCFHRPAGSSTSALARWPCQTPFLYRQRDVIASFFFGANKCTRILFYLQYFKNFNSYIVYRYANLLPFCYGYIMSSPGQRRGKCGHVMANFDTHSHCARWRDKGKGKEPCVSDPQMSNCQICNSLTSD